MSHPIEVAKLRVCVCVYVGLIMTLKRSEAFYRPDCCNFLSFSHRRHVEGSNFIDQVQARHGRCTTPMRCVQYMRMCTCQLPLIWHQI